MTSTVCSHFDLVASDNLTRGHIGHFLFPMLHSHSALGPQNGTCNETWQHMTLYSHASMTTCSHLYANSECWA
jgi:hypothetical protein